MVNSGGEGGVLMIVSFPLRIFSLLSRKSRHWVTVVLMLYFHQGGNFMTSLLEKCTPPETHSAGYKELLLFGVERGCVQVKAFWFELLTAL